jgi:HK97 family phage portal protein
MAGPLVSEATSIRCVDVYRCVSIISGMVASLRLNLYREVNGKRDYAENHRLYPLLRVQPNENISAYNWVELMMVHLLLWGDHFSLIQYDNSGRVVGFRPLSPVGVDVELRADGLLQYRVKTKGGPEVIPAEDMLHIPGMGFDGMRGLSAIQFSGRQAIGTSLAMEEFTARLHSNGVKPSGIVKVKEGISPAAFARMQQQFEQKYSGAGNAGSTLWLDAGSDWTAMQLSPADAQTIEARRFSTVQIGNIFGVPAMLLNENANMTAWGSGIEQIMLGFAKTTINPWLTRIEGELKRKLFLKDNMSVEFDRDGLIALDSKSKAELFSKSINAGIMTPNEARRRMNLPDMDGADGLYIQSGTVPLDTAGEQNSQPAPVDTSADVAAIAADMRERMNALTASVKEAANKEPPSVTVTMPEITIPAPPPVNVTAHINVPKKGTEETIVTAYDEEGRILSFEKREIEDE